MHVPGKAVAFDLLSLHTREVCVCVCACTLVLRLSGSYLNRRKKLKNYITRKRAFELKVAHTSASLQTG